MTARQYTDDLAELALGVLTGRERSRALSHVESCPRCSEELELLSRAADALVAVAPEAEPPLGFETRSVRTVGDRCDAERGLVACEGPGSPPPSLR